MNRILIIITLLASGCASYVDNGRGFKARFQSNIKRVVLKGPDFMLDMTDVNNSTPTASAGRIITKLGALGLAGATGGATGVAGVASKVPALIHSASDFRTTPIELRP